MRKRRRKRDSYNRGAPVELTQQQEIDLVCNNALGIKASLPDHIEVQDLIQEGHIGLIEAKSTHNPLKGPFVPWAIVCIRRAIIGSLRRDYRFSMHEELAETVPASQTSTEDVISARQILDRMSPRERAIVEANYFNGSSLTQIAKTQNVSKSLISKLRTAAFTRVRHEIAAAA